MLKISDNNYFETMPIACHTKHVKYGSTFVAIKGIKEDGASYIPNALAHGATKIVAQEDAIISEDIKKLIEKNNATLEFVADARLALAQLSAKASGYAHKQLKIIGITGTKGKTSTTFILEHILQKAGYNTASISTVHNKINNTIIKSSLTTEQPDYLHHFFKCCVQNNVEFVVMEVSAQALSLHRVADLEFDAIIFTNFAQEHGEFYESLEDYFAAKCKIFDQLKTNGLAFINCDDAWGRKILNAHPKFNSLGIVNPANMSANIVNAKKTLDLLVTHKNKAYKVNCPSIFGYFNTYNILAAFSVSNKLGVSIEECTKHMESFTGIPGRLELYTLKNGARCFIDYAHNPSSYKAALSTLRQMTDDLILVFGAGGERDHERRPIMGGIASQIADTIILTSDNPRTEDPNGILEDIISGILPENRHKIIKELDRKIAIQKACTMAKNTSVITILGKGPDEYQIVGNIKTVFSEKEILATY